MNKKVEPTSKGFRRILGLNLRQRTLATIAITLLLLSIMVLSGIFIDSEKMSVNFEQSNQSPSIEHLFGTDWLGRDMLARTLNGLMLSLGVGLFAAFVSTVIALVMSLLSFWSKTADYIVSWLTDLFLSVPHLVTLILISFVMGGGFKGVVIGLSLTHWPSLARVLRAEILQIRNMEYVQVSYRLGKSKHWITMRHIVPHLIPQLLVGFILLFPHAILHEAAVTFLGFGLSPEQPAIGVILSESMKYLSTGMWWLAFFPGLALLIMVGLFDILGNSFRKLIDPFNTRR
ncbi:ABC transporter permease [Desertibacillus haloalkaliphilus]|uniref:ABC transporter permease n=1 Tax=Desertibacillus haloalkaliphilus TaxID=1328930 RepID=UPI001C25DA46|nr:ABC transporter permease [Desertibacillus haloalkaliphilus]MBU8906354.1 ABC transporter permease [Desertibacillus haloalkaliphilus]